MNEMKNTRGGKRENAGRKRLPDTEKKVSLNLRINPAIKLVLSSLPGSNTSIVESALIEKYNIKI